MSLREIQAGRPGIGASLARAGLRVLSWGFGLGAWLRNAAFDLRVRKARRLGVPVLCVGNIAAGGTGKTPFVIWLARRLQQAGHVPGVVARGYGGRAVTEPDLNDEGAVLRSTLPDVPQVQDPDRYAAGLRMLSAHPRVDVVLLDDGFQHRQLHRDLDVVLVDALRPFGHGHLLPRGLLREGPRALARAGAVVITRAERLEAGALAALEARVRGLTPAPIAIARTVPVGGEGLRGRRVLACCGLGNPDAFLGTLRDLGAEIVGERLLGDHEALPAPEWRGLVARAALRDACVATTRKDAVKVAGLPPEVVVVDVALEVVAGRDRLWEAVRGALGA